MMQRWRGLIIVAGIYLLLGMLYSVITPLFEAPDEAFHFFFVQHVRERQSLPVQNQPGETLYEQEGSQPPLYYLAGALLTSWIDTSDARSLLRQNPQANIGVPGDPGNKNRFIHTAREAFPFHGAVLAAHVLRWWSLLLGLIVVIMTYATARLLLPDQPPAATLAAAVVAFTPQFLFISSVINNDNALNALAALALYLLARLLRGDRTWRTVSVLALIIGLATLAKLSGLILLGFTVCSIGYFGLTRGAQAWHWAVRAMAIVLLGTVTISGWWYLRNLNLYGDITGLSAMYAIVGQRALPLPALIAELPGLWYSTWGVFGWFNIALPDWLYTFYTALVLLAVFGGFRASWRWVRQLRQGRRSLSPEAEGLIGLGLYVLLVFVGVLRWTATTPGSQGRLIFPAASALAILLAGSWLATGLSPRVLAGLSGVCFVMAAVIPWMVIAPEYALPTSIALQDIPADVKRLNVDFNGTVRLIGGKVESPAVRPGDLISVVLYWQALRPTHQEYMVFVHPLGRALELVGTEDAYHGQGTFPTDLWRGDEVIADRFTLRVNSAARAPTLVQVEVGLRDRTTKQSVRVTDATGSPQSGLLVVDEFELRAAPPSTPEVPVYYRFGDLIELVGYDAPHLNESGELAYRLYWRSARLLSDDYTVFAHALDGQGQLSGQNDGPPFDGAYPTSRWQPGEILVEDRIVKLRGTASAATVLVGLYRLSDETRLPIVDSTGRRVTNDEIVLSVRP